MSDAPSRAGPKLVFVYNANSGVFNALSDIAHKLISPETYACNLCALTHSNLGMRREWKEFVEGLGRPLEFLHADELRRKYGVEGAALPAVFEESGGELKVWIGREEINACRTAEELKRLISGRLRG